MFLRILCLMLSILLGSATLALSSESTHERLYRLPNGLTVYLIKDTRFPMVCTRLYVHTGSAHENASNAGISHVLEHMVFKGTAKRPKGLVAKEVESLGGYLNAATSFDRTWYITDMPKEAWRTGLDVVYDMAFHATLTQEDLTSEQDVIVAEKKRGQDSPAHTLFEELQAATFAQTGYAHPIIGFEPTIRAVTSADLQNYRAHWYQPQNMELLMAGDLDLDATMEEINKLFGPLAQTDELAIEDPIDLKVPPTDSVKVLQGDFNKVYLGLAFPAPALKDARSVDLDVLSYLLGGDATAFFLRKYKYEKELVDELDVSNMSLARLGLLSITVTLSQDKLATFFEEITKDLAKLSAKDFSKESLTRAIQALEDTMDRTGETITGLASWKATVAFLLGGEIQEKNLRTRLKSFSTETLDKTIETFLDPAKVRVRVLAPKGAKLPDFAKILAHNWPAKKQQAKEKSAFMQGEAKTVPLGNNCSLVLLPDTHTPYFALHMSMRGGNALLKRNEQGLAHLTAALLSDGAGNYDNQALEKYLVERSLSLTTTAGRETFTLSMEGPSKAQKDLCTILETILHKPRFEPKEVQRELKDMKAALLQRKDAPLSYLFSKLWPMLYQDHCYGFDDLGKTARAFTQGQVRTFWDKQKAQPFVLTVCGSFEEEGIVSFAKALAASKKNAAHHVSNPTLSKERTLNLRLPGRNQAHLIELYPTVPLEHHDTPALMLLASILSGQSGVLFSTLRDEQGLGYTVTAMARSLPMAGSFLFYMGTDPAKLSQAQKGFRQVLAELSLTPLPEEELKKGVARLEGAYVRQNQRLSTRAAEVSDNLILQYPPHLRAELIKKAREVTAEELQQLVLKYLRDETCVTATLLP